MSDSQLDCDTATAPEMATAVHRKAWLDARNPSGSPFRRIAGLAEVAGV